MLCMCQENKMIHKVLLNRYSSTFEIKIETNNKTFLDGQFKVFNFFIRYNIIGKKTLKLGEFCMITARSFKEVDLYSLTDNDIFWNTGDEVEQKMHRIHAYPAKFPAFITTKALEYVEKNDDFYPHKIGDIFCGCGTTAYEARRNNIDFWGCDINPVATLIAKTKSEKYESGWLKKYYESILNKFNSIQEYPKYENANVRLQYWYLESQYNDLSKLKESILQVFKNKNSKYCRFFLCAFSNILKPASKWLTKSIKPQIDPNKTMQDVITLFKKQFLFMFKANQENDVDNNVNIDIQTKSILEENETQNLDMIITSPPYVTSYEYADLHQLSTLWLDFTSDYREFRKGTIGSDFCSNDITNIENLNSSGKEIVLQLENVDKAKARSVAKYYLDMQTVADKSYKLLNRKGYALFVIGNTEYKSVRIDNALQLSEALFDAGFQELQITKRKISNKILTPYRDANGKFSSDSTGRKIYSEEFIIIGKKECQKA